jgi:protein-tyrosine kinase
MERIQEALNKARAARKDARPAGDLTVTPRTGPAFQPAATLSGVAELWAALPELRVDARALQHAHVTTFGPTREAVPFDMMRTRMLQQMQANNWRRIAITSPGPGCGKSTLALNMAFGLARQTALRSLLVEIDLRRPTLRKTLGITAGQGVSEVLDGQAGFADAACRHGANLAFLTATGPRRNSAELLQSPTTRQALDEIEAHYDPTVMLFDMPPMLVGDDVMAFAGLVDCVLLVAAAETTTVKQIDTCERELATQTNVMGVVLNKCRFPGLDLDYGYY